VGDILFCIGFAGGTVSFYFANLHEVVVVAFWAITSTGLLEMDFMFWSVIVRGVSAWLTLGCFVMAIFYAAAFDVGLVLRRTTVVTIVGMMAIGVFITLETTLEEVLEEMLGFESRVGGIIAGVAAALAFRPLSVRIDRWLQRSAEESHR